MKVLCFSGGVDSLAAYFYCKPDKVIYFNLHSKYSKKELECIMELEKHISGFKVEIINALQLGEFEGGRTSFIPYRNSLIAEIASNFGNEIIIAGIKGDKVIDKNPEAFKIMTNYLNDLRDDEVKMRVYSPFWEMTKSDIIKWMLDNVPNAKELLKISISCYSADEGQCGNCPSCLRKAIALENNNIDFNNWFVNDIKKFPQIEDYIKKMKNGEYDIDRANESLKVFEKWDWIV